MIYPFRISYQLVRQKILWSHCGAAIDKCLSHDLIDAVMINNFNLIFLHANKLWNGTETDLQASCAAKYRGNKAAKYNDLSFRIEHRYGRLTLGLSDKQTVRSSYIKTLKLLIVQHSHSSDSSKFGMHAVKTFFLKPQILHWLIENKFKASPNIFTGCLNSLGVTAKLRTRVECGQELLKQ